MSTQPTAAELADRIIASVAQPTSARTIPGLYRELLRLLSQGEPVDLARLAAAADRSLADVQGAIATWTDAEFDEQGRITGYGLTLVPTPHRFTVDDTVLYTWCALDTLFFPAVLDRTAQVESPCPATGTTVHLTVTPTAGVTDLTPHGAVVTVVTPQQPVSLRAEFCNPGRFFATANAARQWQATHPGMSVLPVADAYRICRPMADTLTSGDGSTACC